MFGSWLRCITLAALMGIGGLLGGCAAKAPPYSDRVEHVLVWVLPFDPEPSIPYRDPQDLGQLFAQYLAGALQAEGVKALALDRSANVDTSAVLVVIRGVIHTLEPGAWGIASWIGAGQGRATFATTALVSDARPGARAQSLVEEVRETRWASEEAAVRSCAAEAARALARQLAPSLPRS